MLLPKGGLNWKSARGQLPPYKVVLNFVTRKRFLLLVAVTGLIVLAWRGISSSASEMKRYGFFVLSFESNVLLTL